MAECMNERNSTQSTTNPQSKWTTKEIFVFTIFFSHSDKSYLRICIRINKKTILSFESWNEGKKEGRKEQKEEEEEEEEEEEKEEEEEEETMGCSNNQSIIQSVRTSQSINQAADHSNSIRSSVLPSLNPTKQYPLINQWSDQFPL